MKNIAFYNIEGEAVVATKLQKLFAMTTAELFQIAALKIRIAMMIANLKNDTRRKRKPKMLRTLRT